ncbi:MAG: methionyl-tRNA formyltransferase [Chloroflexi bacterium]|nr:methionyl-tRNA formyltransferase [Chloroflexota bacterium]
MTARARTLFMGSGSFALPVLDVVHAHPRSELVAVVTAPARPVGRTQQLRDTPVAGRAAEIGAPVMTPDRLRDPGVHQELTALAPDLIVLADYGRIVPSTLLEMPRHGPLNVHPSLLPRHRGASPIAATILAGDDESGVTILHMDAGVDTGPIVAQRRVAVPERATVPDLEALLAAAGAELLGDTLGPWLDGAIDPVAQSTSGVSLTRPLRRDDGRLDASRSAGLLERQVRAYRPWPGSWLDTVAGRVTVLRAMAVPASALGPGPGNIPGVFVDAGALDGTPALTTSDGLLLLLEVLPAGGRSMEGAEWLRGRTGIIGSRVTAGTLG